MVQTSLSTQTKVLLVSAAALATGLAAYALGYYDYDWRLWQQGTPNLQTDNTAVRQTAQDVQTEAGGVRQYPATDVQTDSDARRADQPANGVTLITDPRLPDATVGVPYQVVLQASTGANTRWMLEQGALPGGLVLDEAYGKITGVATNPGPSLFRLKFGTNESSSVSQFTLNVIGGSDTVTTAAAPSQEQETVKITTENLPEARVGEQYSHQFQAIGDDPAVRFWSLRVDPSPGLSLSSTDGKLMGQPTTAGTYLLNVTLVGKTNDAARNPVNVTRQYSLVVRPMQVAQPAVPADLPLKIISNTTLPAGRVGEEYKFQFQATGGPQGARYSWQNFSGVPGLTGDANGFLTGIPTAAGTYTLRGVTVSTGQASGGSVSVDAQIQILPRETVVSTSDPATAPFYIVGGYQDGTIGNYYSSRPLEVTGGKAPFEWIVVSGNIPPGLSFSPNSQIAGYANQYGIFIFTVQVRDQDNRTVRAERTIHIRPSQPVVSASVDPDLSNRLRRIDLMGVQVHDLIKLQDDGNPDTQFDTTVYYIGADGRRHSFPNPKVYFSWFPDFSRVRIVASRELADIPLGANLTYRPGTKLVKFMTDPRVYAVDSDRRLRWVKTEAVAVSLYGPFWARQVDDISDAFYMDYRFGPDIDRTGDYSTNGAMGTAVYPSDVLPR